MKRRKLKISKGQQVSSEASHHRGVTKDSLTIKEIQYNQASSDNPDLPMSFIRDVLDADLERKQGLLSEYHFGFS